MPRKLGSSKSKRFEMTITEDELAAIEDWQFSNHVPSKSKAIRRLVEIGLLGSRPPVNGGEGAEFINDQRHGDFVLRELARAGYKVVRRRKGPPISVQRPSITVRNRTESEQNGG